MNVNTPKNSILYDVAPQGIAHSLIIHNIITIAVMIKFIFSKFIAVFELKQHNKDANAIIILDLINYIKIIKNED